MTRAEVPELFELVEDWAGYLEAVEGKSPRTIEAYRQRVEGFLRDSGAEGPGFITFAALEAHLKRLFAAGRSETTRAMTITAARTFCKYLGARGFLEGNPADSLKAPSPYRKEKDVLTREEVKRLVWDRREGIVPINPYEMRNRTIWWTMYIVGLRRSEVGPLRKEQLEWHPEDGVLVYSLLLRGSKASREDVRMPLDPQGSRLLAHYLQAGGARDEISRDSPFLFPADHDGMISSTWIYKLFKARVKAAGIRPQGRRISPHILRHSIATHLLEAGADIEQVRSWMRHSSVEVTGNYLHTARAHHLDRAKFLQKHHPMQTRGSKEPDLRRAMDGLMRDLRSNMVGARDRHDE